ncbi:MAG: hypothetical protein JW717_02545 [Marinilabiliaceae bacterium]|nr:hypothetical protein [Marinilabiliaceae bacterium]
MNKIIYLLPIGLVLIISSCFKVDEPDISDYDYISVGDVVSIDNGLEIRLLKDEHLKDVSFDFGDSIEVGSRVKILYNFISNDENQLSPFLVNIKDLRLVPVDSVFYVTNENRDTIETDGVVIGNCYLSDHYLNLDFFYYGDTAAHYFKLGFDSLQQDNNSFNFMLIHNSTDSVFKYRFYKTLSFDLNSFPWTGDAPYDMKLRYYNYTYSSEIDMKYTPPGI